MCLHLVNLLLKCSYFRCTVRSFCVFESPLALFSYCSYRFLLRSAGRDTSPLGIQTSRGNLSDRVLVLSVKLVPHEKNFIHSPLIHQS